ncbi:MAG: hypothetical protein AB7O96_09735, partial [Pseudobdellovibrionaceae bacterium]
LQEYLQDLTYKGTMFRVGVGLEIGKFLTVGLYQDTFSLKTKLSDTDKGVVCTNWAVDGCSERGSLRMTHFVVSTSL